MADGDFHRRRLSIRGLGRPRVCVSQLQWGVFRVAAKSITLYRGYLHYSSVICWTGISIAAPRWPDVRLCPSRKVLFSIDKFFRRCSPTPGIVWLSFSCRVFLARIYFTSGSLRRLYLRCIRQFDVIIVSPHAVVP